MLPHFKQDIEEFLMIPSDKGKFEVFVDGHQIYSKLETGEFPVPRDIVEALEARRV